MFSFDRNNLRMTNEDLTQQIVALSKELEKDLIRECGIMVYGQDLCRILGYSSLSAFRQSVYRNTVPVTLFSIPKRRGKFALSKDIAYWLAKQRLENI